MTQGKTGKQRVVMKRTQVLREVEYLEGCALSPMHYLSAGLWKDVNVKFNNTQLPLTTKQMYYFQSIINLMLTVRDPNVLANFKGGLYENETIGSTIDNVKPFDLNHGLTERFSRLVIIPVAVHGIMFMFHVSEAEVQSWSPWSALCLLMG